MLVYCVVHGGESFRVERDILYTGFNTSAGNFTQHGWGISMTRSTKITIAFEAESP